jgi:predicted XRE-type DNA-binding protein
MEETYASVWDAIEDSPAEAANLRARWELMHALQARVANWGVSQSEAARRLGVTQPRLNDLLQGRIAKFSLDALVNLLEPAGLTLRLDIEAA